MVDGSARAGMPWPILAPRSVVPRSASHRSLATFVRALFVFAWLLLAVGAGAGAVRAADPSPAPTPLVFHNPQYLVWMENHASPNGIVEDKAYWLYISPPDEKGHFVVPDGGGLVWHYFGRLIGGPFTGAADACPAMLGVGVTSLQARMVAAGEEAQVVDCSPAATPPPAVATTPDPAASPDAGSASGPAAGPGGEEDVDPESLGIAVALIGLLLFGGGSLLNLASRPAPLEATDFGPGARSDVDLSPPAPPQPLEPPQPPEPPADPCADQSRAVQDASAIGQELNDLLATCRRHQELLQSQIDTLANVVLPGSVTMDVLMAAGGLSGGFSRKLIASESFAKALGEAVVKDVIKELAKQGLGSAGGGVDIEKLMAEGSKSTIKAAVLQALEESIVNRRFFGSAYPTAPTVVARNLADYDRLAGRIKGFRDAVASPVKDSIGSLFDLYEGVSNGFELKARLDSLRALYGRLDDVRVNLEIQLEDAIGQQRFAAERLAKCRQLNAPGWRP
jgi:hypothetical protein